MSSTFEPPKHVYKGHRSVPEHRSTRSRLNVLRTEDSRSGHLPFLQAARSFCQRSWKIEVGIRLVLAFNIMLCLHSTGEPVGIHDDIGYVEEQAVKFLRDR